MDDVSADRFSDPPTPLHSYVSISGLGVALTMELAYLGIKIIKTDNSRLKTNSSKLKTNGSKLNCKLCGSSLRI
jgi:hypothetical protein